MTPNQQQCSLNTVAERRSTHVAGSNTKSYKRHGGRVATASSSLLLLLLLSSSAESPSRAELADSMRCAEAPNGASGSPTITSTSLFLSSVSSAPQARRPNSAASSSAYVHPSSSSSSSPLFSATIDYYTYRHHHNHHQPSSSLSAPPSLISSLRSLSLFVPTPFQRLASSFLLQSNGGFGIATFAAASAPLSKVELNRIGRHVFAGRVLAVERQSFVDPRDSSLREAHYRLTVAVELVLKTSGNSTDNPTSVYWAASSAASASASSSSVMAPTGIDETVVAPTSSSSGGGGAADGGTPLPTVDVIFSVAAHDSREQRQRMAYLASLRREREARIGGGRRRRSVRKRPSSEEDDDVEEEGIAMASELPSSFDRPIGGPTAEGGAEDPFVVLSEHGGAGEEATADIPAVNETRLFFATFFGQRRMQYEQTFPFVGLSSPRHRKGVVTKKVRRGGKKTSNINKNNKNEKKEKGDEVTVPAVPNATAAESLQPATAPSHLDAPAGGSTARTLLNNAAGEREDEALAPSASLSSEQKQQQSTSISDIPTGDVILTTRRQKERAAEERAKATTTTTTAAAAAARRKKEAEAKKKLDSEKKNSAAAEEEAKSNVPVEVVAEVVVIPSTSSTKTNNESNTAETTNTASHQEQQQQTEEEADGEETTTSDESASKGGPFVDPSARKAYLALRPNGMILLQPAGGSRGLGGGDNTNRLTSLAALAAEHYLSPKALKRAEADEEEQQRRQGMNDASLRNGDSFAFQMARTAAAAARDARISRRLSRSRSRSQSQSRSLPPSGGPETPQHQQQQQQQQERECNRTDAAAPS